MIPPEAITGTFTASTTCGTSAIVPPFPIRNFPERPPMTSGFAALGHDRVHSGLRERNRLFDGSRCPDQEHVSAFDLLDGS
jgi:hypothetical protein